MQETIKQQNIVRIKGEGEPGDGNEFVVVDDQLPGKMLQVVHFNTVRRARWNVASVQEGEFKRTVSANKLEFIAEDLEAWVASWNKPQE